MNDILRFEWYKLKKERLLLLCIFILSILAVLGTCGVYLLGSNEWSPELNGAEMFLDSFGDNSAIFIMSIFIANFVTMEFQTGRIKLIISTVEKKSWFYLSKLLVCCVGFCIGIISMSVMYSISSTIAWGFDPNGVFRFSRLLLFILTESIILCAYTSIFVFIAICIKSYGHAVAINMIILLFAPMILKFIDFITNQHLGVSYLSLDVCSNKIATYTPSIESTIIALFVSLGTIIITTHLGLEIFNKRDVE